MFRWCDAVVCNSRAAAERLAASGLPGGKTVVIGNGMPSSAFTLAAPALPRVPGRLRVGMIARMNAASKNHSLFLRAAARICFQNQEVDFILAGDGPLRGDLEQEAEKLGCRGRILFLGDRRDVPEVLAAMDISVLPSASESLSNVILESMAAGVPVIANWVGGNVELLGEDKGILIEPHNEDDLVRAIQSLLRDPGRRSQLGHRAQEFARANFTIENLRTQHERLYADLLQRKNWRPKATPRGVPPSQKTGRTNCE
jgi:glycosyltransferase involved in cell wall biosynthesis